MEAGRSRRAVDAPVKAGRHRISIVDAGAAKMVSRLRKEILKDSELLTQENS